MTRSSISLQAAQKQLFPPLRSRYPGLWKQPTSIFRPLQHRERRMSTAHAPSLGGVYDTTHSSVVRKYKRTYGLTPPAVEDYKLQLARCLTRLERKERPIDKYMYLSRLRNCDVHTFYRLVIGNIKEIAPLIYTPTVGEACLRVSARRCCSLAYHS